MHAALVRFAIDWKMGTSSMSDFIEIIYSQTMTAKLIENGEVIGGIGVSGVMSHQDAQVAQAGMGAIR